MAGGGHEARRVAAPHRMHVESVEPGRQAAPEDRDRDLAASLNERDATDLVALRVHQRCRRRSALAIVLAHAGVGRGAGRAHGNQAGDDRRDPSLLHLPASFVPKRPLGYPETQRDLRCPPAVFMPASYMPRASDEYTSTVPDWS